MNLDHLKEWINKFQTTRQHTHPATRSSSFPLGFGDIKASCSTRTTSWWILRVPELGVLPRQVIFLNLSRTVLVTARKNLENLNSKSYWDKVFLTHSTCSGHPNSESYRGRSTSWFKPIILVMARHDSRHLNSESYQEKVELPENNLQRKPARVFYQGKPLYLALNNHNFRVSELEILPS